MPNSHPPFPPSLDSVFAAASIAPPPSRPPHLLHKQRTWSPDTEREEAWMKRSRRKDRGKSVTDEDLEELKACIELGFGFGCDSPELDRKRLADTLPALRLYYAINKHYSDTKSLSSSKDSRLPDREMSHHNILYPGDDPEMVKERLRQWAQVVACSVRQSLC